MAQAVYEYVAEDDGTASVFGSIPELPGVWSHEPTYPECQQELQSALEDWLLFGLQLGHQLPVLDEINLTSTVFEVA
jgi:predicted RNase H-like HicB family nuclease